MRADIDIAPATETEVAALLAGSRETYAAGLAAQRGFTAREATERAAADVAALLPQGAGTPGHLFLAARRHGRGFRVTAQQMIRRLTDPATP